MARCMSLLRTSQCQCQSLVPRALNRLTIFGITAYLHCVCPKWGQVHSCFVPGPSLGSVSEVCRKSNWDSMRSELGCPIARVVARLFSLNLFQNPGFAAPVFVFFSRLEHHHDWGILREDVWIFHFFWRLGSCSKSKEQVSSKSRAVPKRGGLNQGVERKQRGLCVGGLHLCDPGKTPNSSGRGALGDDSWWPTGSSEWWAGGSFIAFRGTLWLFKTWIARQGWWAIHRWRSHYGYNSTLNHETKCFLGQPFLGLDFEPLPNLRENGMHSRHRVSTHILTVICFYKCHMWSYIHVYIDMGIVGKR